MRAPLWSEEAGNVTTIPTFRRQRPDVITDKLHLEIIATVFMVRKLVEIIVVLVTIVALEWYGCLNLV